MKEFMVVGARCWAAEVAAGELGVYVPEGPCLAATAAQATGARLVLTGTFFEPETGKLCGLLRAGDRRWGGQSEGRPLLAVQARRARVLAAAADDPGADLVIGGGPAFSSRLGWRDSYLQGRYTGLVPDSAVPRVALGVKADGLVVVVLVAEALTLQALAETLAAQGCADGMALDGGGSAALVWEESLVFGGQRPLPSFVIAGLPAEARPPAGGRPTGRRLNDVAVAKNFRLYEFESPDTREVMVAPELVERLQALRDRLGRPVIVASGYRTAARNWAVGGTPRSPHRKGEAADIKVPGLKPDAVARVAEEVGFHGVRVYADHLHVDVGQGRPEPWAGCPLPRSTPVETGPLPVDSHSSKLVVLASEATRGSRDPTTACARNSAECTCGLVAPPGPPTEPVGRQTRQWQGLA